MQKQLTILRKWSQRWLFPVTACFVIVTLLGGCFAQEAAPSSSVQDLSVETRKALEQLSASSEKLYQAMKADDPVQARTQLESIARQFPSVSLEGMVSAEGMEAVYVALGEARKTFNAVQFDPRSGIREAAKIRLLFDTLSQPKHPMWKAYYKPMADNVNQIQQAAQEQQAEELLTAYRELSGRYAMIKPSLAVTHPAQQLVKADSMFVFLQSHIERDTPAFTHIEAVHNDLTQLLRELFGRDAASADVAAYSPSLPIHPVLYWGAAIGSFILTILAFVGYRRYRYERDRPPSIRQKHD